MDTSGVPGFLGLRGPIERWVDDLNAYFRATGRKLEPAEAQGTNLILRTAPDDLAPVIKYLGSKRRLVPVLGALCERRRGAHRARPVHRHDARRAGVQAPGRTSPRSTPRATPRCSRGCYVATDADARRSRASSATRSHDLDALPGRPRLRHRDVLRQSRFFQPENGAPDRRDPRRDRARPRGLAARTRSCSPACIEAADRVDSTTGVQMAYLKQWAPALAPTARRCACPSCSPAPGARVRGDALDARRRRSAGSTSRTSTRPTTSTATSRTTTCGRRSWRGTRPSTTASPASAIDARDPIDQERVQRPARDARGAARA